MTSQTQSAAEGLFRAIRTPAYLILTLAIALPFFDYVNGLFPLHLGDPLWRFGATSLIASYAVATTVQLFFLFVVAVGAGDRRVLIVVCVIGALMAVGLLAGSALYILDAIQTRARTSAGTQTRLEMTAGLVMFKLIALTISNIVLARAAMKASRQVRVPSGKSDQVIVRRPSVPVTPQP
jgi:hypothetical protein